MNFIQEKQRLIGISAKLNCDIVFTAKLISAILKERLIRAANIPAAIDNILISDVTGSEKRFLTRVKEEF